MTQMAIFMIVANALKQQKSIIESLKNVHNVNTHLFIQT